jgi:membrane protease YdiL (CAAX protease family)
MLYAAFALGYPWFSAWLWARLPEGNLSWLIEEASVLGLVCVLVALMRGFRRASVSRSDARAVPPQALFLLGIAALALRLIDPGFDSQEIGQAGLEAAGVLAGFLLTLPFAVAAEELIFRTCQSRLRRLLPPGPAIVAVGFAFAIYHWVPGTPLDRHAIESELALVAGGMVFAAAYERAGNLWMMIAIHLIYDGLAIAQGLLNVRHDRLAEATVFLLWLAVSGLLGWRWRRTPAASAPDGPPEPAAHRAAAWASAAVFGCGFPLLLVWIRIRLG